MNKKKRIKLKKAQAAMEFLMTYGWAILVVLIVIGLFMYFGPLDVMGETCTLSPPLGCKDYKVNDETSMTLQVKNGLMKDVMLTKAELTDAGCTDSNLILVGGGQPEIKKGAVESILIDGCVFPGSKVKSKIIITYDVEGGLSGKVSAGHLVSFVPGDQTEEPPEEPPGNQTCSDGTNYGECSITKPKYCQDGNLIDDCASCSCDVGYGCNLNGTCSLIGNQTCSDGTNYGECSVIKPKYCQDGSLIDDCVTCDCDIGYGCNLDGTCSLIEEPPLNDTNQTGPFVCGDGICYVGEDSINCPEDCGSVIPTSKVISAKFSDVPTGGVVRELFIIDPFTGQEYKLTSGFNDYCPELSTDKSKVLFTRKHPTGQSGFDLYKIDINSGELSLLHHNMELGSTGNYDLDESCPQWSPDGNEILFLVWGGLRDIWKINQNGAGLTSLSTASQNEEYFRWSPDGTKAIFSKGDVYINGVRSESIFLINKDGTNLQQITSKEGYFDRFPEFSPDGNYISFVRLFSPRELIIKDLRTNEEFVLPSGTYTPYLFPKWSPDGSKILYQCENRICLATLNYGALQNSQIKEDLTGFRVNHHYEWLSSDEFVFNALDDNTNVLDLYRMKTTDSSQTKITNGEFRNDYRGNIGT